LKRLNEYIVFSYSNRGINSFKKYIILNYEEREHFKVKWRWGYEEDQKCSYIDMNESVLSIKFDEEKTLFIDIKIIVTKQTFLKWPENTIEFNYGEKFIREQEWSSPNIGIEFNPFNEFGGNFKPYNIEKVYSSYIHLSSSISNLFGHETMYFKTDPDKKYGDIVFREWTLYNVRKPKCIKIVIPENKFPDEKLKYEEFGIDYESPFEVHIVRQDFERAFGIGSLPQKRDIVYLNFNNRLYEVANSYLDSVNEFPYYKVSLVKFQPKHNIDLKDATDLKELYEEGANSFESLFSEEIKNEEVNALIPQQYSPNIGSNSNIDFAKDPVRFKIDESVTVINKNINSGKYKILDSYYDLRVSKETIDDNKIVVEYTDMNNRGLEPHSNNRSITFWLMPLEETFNSYIDKIENINYDKNTNIGDLNILKLRDFKIGDNFVLRRFSKNLILCEIIDVNYIGNSTFLKFKIINNPKESFIPSPGWEIQKIYVNNILNSDNIYLKQWTKEYYELKINDDSLFFNLEKEEWYACVINISNTHNLISIDIWERTEKDIVKIQNLIKKLSFEYVPNDKFFLSCSNNLISNIRIYDILTPEEKQKQLLTDTYVIDNANYAILIDNAKPLLDLKFLSKSK